MPGFQREILFEGKSIVTNRSIRITKHALLWLSTLTYHTEVAWQWDLRGTTEHTRLAAGQLTRAGLYL